METCYEPGVKLYVDKQRKVSVLKGETKRVDTTTEFRTRWARPWQRCGGSRREPFPGAGLTGKRRARS